MTCRDVERVLDLFLDGELEGRAMRAVALHVTRCASCEQLLQRLERLQDAVGDGIAEAVAEVDFSPLWPGVSARVAGRHRAWLGRAAAVAERARAWTAAPAVSLATVVAAVALLAAVVWRGGLAAVGEPTRLNNQVRITSLASDAPSVALLSEPHTNMTVIWVADEGGRE